MAVRGEAISMAQAVRGFLAACRKGIGFDCADTPSLVLVVPLWDYSRRIVEFGHQYHGASGDIGSPWGNVPN